MGRQLPLRGSGPNNFWQGRRSPRFFGAFFGAMTISCSTNKPTNRLARAAQIMHLRANGRRDARQDSRISSRRVYIAVVKPARLHFAFSLALRAPLRERGDLSEFLAARTCASCWLDKYCGIELRVSASFEPHADTIVRRAQHA